MGTGPEIFLKPGAAGARAGAGELALGGVVALGVGCGGSPD